MQACTLTLSEWISGIIEPAGAVSQGVCRGAQSLCRVCEGVPHINIYFLLLGERRSEKASRGSEGSDHRGKAP
jgi:hypothetical protein